MTDCPNQPICLEWPTTLLYPPLTPILVIFLDWVQKSPHSWNLSFLVSSIPFFKDALVICDSLSSFTPKADAWNATRMHSLRAHPPGFAEHTLPGCVRKACLSTDNESIASASVTSHTVTFSVLLTIIHAAVQHKTLPKSQFRIINYIRYTKGIE